MTLRDHRNNLVSVRSDDVTCGPADLVFILDNSYNISSNDYTEVKKFTASIVDYLEIGVDGFRVGAVVFASEVTVAFTLEGEYRFSCYEHVFLSLLSSYLVRHIFAVSIH